MKWSVNRVIEATGSDERLKAIIDCLLKNRGLVSEEDREAFFNPPQPESFSMSEIGLDKMQVELAIKTIKDVIAAKKKIIVYGDYDADGITATAIMWEMLRHLGADVLPYIPDRVTEGYGLNINSLAELIDKYPDLGLIVTVDQGIVADEAIRFIGKKKVKVIVTDHHQAGEKLPQANAVIHTTQTSGSGVAWWFTLQLQKAMGRNEGLDTGLELATIGTVADLLPLVGINRSLIKHGLEKLRASRRPGLLALLASAGVDQSVIDTYHIGFLIAPRLNAMGRLEHAMDSLRLLCTRDRERAALLAEKLDLTNRQRQDLTEQTFLHAINAAQVKAYDNKLIIVDDISYAEGIIGLVAGKLVERFSRPAIVLSRGDKFLKASARSINAFNIIEAIRSAGEWYERAGGHPMAAGFTIQVEKYQAMVEYLQKYANEKLTEEDLQKRLEIDVEIEFKYVTDQLVSKMKQFSPFGLGNPEPLFMTRNVLVTETRTVGKKNQHLKLGLSQGGPASTGQGGRRFSGIAFYQGQLSDSILNQTVDVAYNVVENIWNGRSSVELKVKDILSANKA